MSRDDLRAVPDGSLEDTAEDLYEHAPCGYLSTLPDGTIFRVNQAFVEWTGTTREALLSGATFQRLLSIGSRIYYETHLAPLLRMQGFVDQIALELSRTDGRTLPVLVNARQRQNADGTAVDNRITVFDATDRRRYEQELLLARRKAERIAKDRADLLGMLSHDIRNPLNALMGTVQLLERSELAAPQRRLVGVLKSSSEHMLALLDHVLELSRAESSSFALVETPFSLRDVITDVVNTFETPARGKNLDLRASVPESLPQAMIGDPLAIRQVLTNLVGNAVKFTPRGRVEVTAVVKELGTDGVTVTLAVADTGIGIAPGAVGRIFDEFVQAGRDTAERFGGSGLGLFITRRLLELFGSRMNVTSVPGEGSRFSFDLRLPLPPSAPP
jgi:PAS domain S-box-containing protein